MGAANGRIQDGHSKSEASATFENLSAELETNRAKVTTLESKLETEEAELEEIRDGLKGQLAAVVIVASADFCRRQDR